MDYPIFRSVSRRSLLWVALLGALLLVMAGCAPRAGADEVAINQDADLALSLPSVVLESDASGQLSVEGVPLQAVGAALGQDLSAVQLPADMVQTLMDAGVQHLQVTDTGEGLSILANGMELPSISWTDGALASAGELLTGLGVLDSSTAEVLPLLEQTGVGAVISLPVAEGTEPVPLESGTVDEMAAVAQEEQANFLTAVRDRVPSIAMTISYNENGEATVGGIPVALLNSLGVSLDALNQDPAFVAQMKASGISNITLLTDADGVHAAVNGSDLPYLDWGDGKMMSLIGLLRDAGALDGLSDSPEGQAAMLGLIQKILPIVQASNLNVTVNFD
ncbi:MAG: hypothetical protein KDD92_05140 [Caldilineaceae bacterium]|nr:hypothetical protein [Caldilineaceae bacterium]